MSTYFEEVYQAITSGAYIQGYEYQIYKQIIPESTVECKLRVYTIDSEFKTYFIGVSMGGCISPDSAGSIFTSIDKQSWTYQFSIIDMNKTYFTETNQYSNGNTPIAFTKEDGQLLLTIVDKNGGGSLDGIGSVLALQSDGSWKTVKCFDYSNWGIFENTRKSQNDNERYYNGTTQFDKLLLLPLEDCKDNVKIEKNKGVENKSE